MIVALSKVKFQLVFIIDAQYRSERAPHFANKALHRPDLALTQQLFNLGGFKGASTGVFANRKVTCCTSKTPIVFFDHTTTFWAWGLQRDVIAGNGVTVILFGTFDDHLGHLRDFTHERLAGKSTLFNLFKLVLPFASQLGRCQLFYIEPGQQGH